MNKKAKRLLSLIVASAIVSLLFLVAGLSGGCSSISLTVKFIEITTKEEPPCTNPV